jgi:hypothetical protein
VNPDKIQVFWEGHKTWNNLPLDWRLLTKSQIKLKIVSNFCGLFRISELKALCSFPCLDSSPTSSVNSSGVSTLGLKYLCNRYANFQCQYQSVLLKDCSILFCQDWPIKQMMPTLLPVLCITLHYPSTSFANICIRVRAIHKLFRLKIGDFWPSPSPIVVFFTR